MPTLGCVADPVSCVTGSATNVFFEGLGAWVAGATGWVWKELGSVLAAQSSTNDILAAASGEFARLAALAPLVAVTALVTAAIAAVRRGDPRSLARDLGAAVFLVVIGVLGAQSMARLILSATDALASAASVNVTSALDGIATRANSLSQGVPSFAVFLLDLAGIVGAMILWFELVIRNALLALLLALSPVVMAAGIFAPCRRLAVRLPETFVALALSKVVVVVALSLGASAIATGSVGVVVTGIAVVLLATLAPFVLLRVVPLFEGSALLAAEGLRQRATGAARRTAQMAVAGAEMGLPAAAVGPPAVREDLGLDEWPTSPIPPTAPQSSDDGPVTAPVGEMRYRYGRPHYTHDDDGKPYMGWHWDE